MDVLQVIGLVALSQLSLRVFQHQEGVGDVGLGLHFVVGPFERNVEQRVVRVRMLDWPLVDGRSQLL